jgi:hypothetical protein
VQNHNIVFDCRARQIGGANPSQILQFTQLAAGVPTFVVPTQSYSITFNIPGLPIGVPQPTTGIIPGRNSTRSWMCRLFRTRCRRRSLTRTRQRVWRV